MFTAFLKHKIDIVSNSNRGKGGIAIEGMEQQRKMSNIDRKREQQRKGSNSDSNREKGVIAKAIRIAIVIAIIIEKGEK